jgi:hypothetical protein
MLDDPAYEERAVGWGGVGWGGGVLMLPLLIAPPAKTAAADLGRDATVLLRGLSIPRCQRVCVCKHSKLQHEHGGNPKHAE